MSLRRMREEVCPAAQRVQVFCEPHFLFGVAVTHVVMVMWGRPERGNAILAAGRVHGPTVAPKMFIICAKKLRDKKKAVAIKPFFWLHRRVFPTKHPSSRQTFLPPKCPPKI